MAQPVSPEVGQLVGLAAEAGSHVKLHYGIALETRSDVRIVALSMRGGKAHRCSVIHHSTEYVAAHQVSADGVVLQSTLYRSEDRYPG
jgi:hypothetical protein